MLNEIFLFTFVQYFRKAKLVVNVIEPYEYTGSEVCELILTQFCSSKEVIHL
jgi:hypothetical protein